VRITEFQREKIREVVKANFGVKTHIYLFGSRTDDEKRGYYYEKSEKI